MMTDLELQAATAMYHALKLCQCTCRYQWPYNTDPGEQLHHCHICKALAGWDAVRCAPLQSVLDAGRVP